MTMVLAFTGFSGGGLVLGLHEVVLAHFEA
jgi:hypothetical protein